MALCYLVYATIPDKDVVKAHDAAEALSKTTGAICDWEFYDSTRAKYWFSNAEAWTAFKSYCALMNWRVVKMPKRVARAGCGQFHSSAALVNLEIPM